jgi:MOSC domain-containing protein YiiM
MVVEEASEQHRAEEELERGLEEIRSAPATDGVVRLIVRRPDVDGREVLREARLDVAEGLVGDTWRSRGNRHTPDGSADPEAQITVVNARAIAHIAGDIQRWPLAGDQLYVDFDLSEANLPPGSRVSIGDAELEISEKPHTGCAKYAARFGADALRFVSSREGRALRLRGVNARVIRGGAVRVGDRIARADA